MKFIPLHASVTRCRPEPPLTQLHNDCGQQEKCARRLAANTDGRPTEDFSKGAYAGYGYVVMCTKYIGLVGSESAREYGPTKKMPEVKT